LMSDLTGEFGATFPTSTAAFAAGDVNAVLAGLVARCRAFAAGPGADASDTRIELAAEARYPSQVWELEVPLRSDRFASPGDVEQFRHDFHEHHNEVYAVCDPQSPVEIVGWRARVSCRLRPHNPPIAATSTAPATPLTTQRRAYFADTGLVDAEVCLFETIDPGRTITGPAIVESPVTTIVVDPGTVATRSPNGSLIVDLTQPAHPQHAAAGIVARGE